MTKFNAIGHDLMRDFHIGTAGLGVLSSVYFWGNLIFLFPAGLLLDRFSSKKLLIIMMIIVIVSTAVFAYTYSIVTVSWCFFITGIAGSFGLIAPLRLVTRWFPSNKLALPSGLIVTVGFFGAMVSQYPLTILVSKVGWRNAMIWNAGLGIIILILFVLVIRDFPQELTKEASDEYGSSIRSLLYSLKEAVLNRQNWLFGIYACLLNLPIFIFGMVFGASYMVQVQHISSSHAAFAMTVMFLGAMLGSPIIGGISDRLKRRKLPMLAAGIISLLLLILPIYLFSMNYVEIYVLFFAIGFFTSAQVIAYPVIAESNKEKNIGIGFSMVSTLIMFGGAILVPIFGWLLNLHWGGEMLHSTPWHSLPEYQFALWLLPIVALIGIVAVILGKETYCKSAFVPNKKH